MSPPSASDWPALIARVRAGERAKDVAREAGVDGRRLRMKALNADPEFAAANRERSRERMKALHADPEFAAASRERMKALNADPEFAAAHRERNRERMKALNADPEFNPLVLLTEAERADYDTLKQAGYTRDDAFFAIGRLDLVQHGGAAA
ncbi:hypothetical protein [Amaricoccus sp. W119]|uniref:hypothetical protein n=1 Tax=Amaricoccus sp. W119 TaxID=3391833 RepID=UPI0039A7441F